MIGFRELLVILVVVLLVFGTKKLRNLGSDLGAGIKDFKKAISEGEKEVDTAERKPVDEKTDKPA
jgi:sec-independent protein translocase protein TatA